jgi:DNA polymerase III subunit delta
MIFFYYGEDSFRAYQKIKAIEQKFQDKVDKNAQNIQTLDAEFISADDFWQAIRAQGFLADKKLVIIKNIFSNRKLKDWQDELIKYLNKQEDTTEENYLVFWQTGKVDSRLKLFKALKKFKFVEEFVNLKPLEVKKWIERQVANKNKTITPQAIDVLLSYVGNNLWQLWQEINKLSNYCDKDITDQDVKILVQAKIDENIFNFVDALGNKDKALALNMLENQINNGVNSQYILTMVTRQYRILIKAKSLESQIKYPGALAQALKIPSLVAEKAMAQSKMYDLIQLKKIYQQLLVLDEKFKSTVDQEKILFAQVINSL